MKLTPYKVVLMEAHNMQRHHAQVAGFETVTAQEKAHHKEITEWWAKIVKFMQDQAKP